MVKRKLEKSSGTQFIGEEEVDLLHPIKQDTDDETDEESGAFSESDENDLLDFNDLVIESSDDDDIANSSEGDEGWETEDENEEIGGVECNKIDPKLKKLPKTSNLKSKDAKSKISNDSNCSSHKDTKVKKYKKKRSIGKKQNSFENVGQMQSSSSSSSYTEKKATVVDEYADGDSSDEEDLRNTIGNVPINWYDEYPHLGYNLDSAPIMKPIKSDTLDKFLEKMENPDFNRTVLDKQTGENVKLSDEDVDIVQRLLGHRNPDKSYDMYAPFLDLYSHEVSDMPLSGRAEHKRSFIPSKAERKKVLHYAMIYRHPRLFGIKKRKKTKPKYFDIWRPRTEEDDRIRRMRSHIPAPKMEVPTTDLSYNPPPEYMMTKKDVATLEGKGDPDYELFTGMKKHRYKTILDIPAYSKAIQDRFERLMDLYISPRMRKAKLVAKSTDFLPKLPPKKDLRPFPTTEAICFKGHRSIIRTISIHPNGKFLASGSDDHTVKIWEVNTGRCLRSFNIEEAVKVVAWNPNPQLFMIAVAFGKNVVCLSPETYLTDRIVLSQTNAIFKEVVEQGDYIVPERVRTAATWRKPTEEEWTKGYRLVVEHFKEVSKLIWHRQGDYFSTVVPEGNFRSVIMHQLSRWRSQLPFTKDKGRVQTIAFHPKLPQFFVVTQTKCRIYDLQRQRLIKKIQCGSRWISSIAVHPSGNHFVIGGYDRKINWFEMECTKRPHLMRYHHGAVRGVAFHRKYPMFATCSDDKKTVVTHSMIYDDWIKDPLIVPLKQLKGHRVFHDFYVLDVTWHPHEPYLFTAGADATIKLWT